MTCEKPQCRREATHLSGIGNGNPQWHLNLCPYHTNERMADNAKVWFRSIGTLPAGLRVVPVGEGLKGY